MSTALDRLAIGTAQFGDGYGLFNSRQDTPQAEVDQIISTLRDQRCLTLDTAALYPGVEEKLGSSDLSDFAVVTKLPHLPEDGETPREWVLRSVEQSMARLNVNFLHGLMLHRPENLEGPSGPEVYEALVSCKSQGLVGRVGISVYDPEELGLFDKYPDLDLLQVPFNVLDRRFDASGAAARLAAAGIEIHVRSVFLQGLLLASRTEIPEWAERWSDIWDEWHGWLEAGSRDAYSTCLEFVCLHPWAHRVVVGIDGLQQAQELCRTFARLTENSAGQMPPISCDDLDLISPVNWKKFAK